MTRSVRTSTSIYTDPDLSGWSVFAFHLYQYLFANDHVHGLTGIGRILEKVILGETRLTPKQFVRAKAEIGDRVLWFDDGTYFVTARAKHAAQSPKHVPAIEHYLSECSEQVRQAFWGRYEKRGPGKDARIYPIATVSIGNHALPSVSVSVSVPVTVPVTVPVIEQGASPPLPPAPINQIVEGWNEQAKKLSLPVIRDVGKPRRDAIGARWTSPFWRDNWGDALAKVAASKFCLGENDRGWRATFDWFVRPQTVTKLVEGAYDGAAKTGRDVGRRFAAAEEQRGKFAGVGALVRNAPDAAAGERPAAGVPPSAPGAV